MVKAAVSMAPSRGCSALLYQPGSEDPWETAGWEEESHAALLPPARTRQLQDSSSTF